MTVWQVKSRQWQIWLIVSGWLSLAQCHSLEHFLNQCLVLSSLLYNTMIHHSLNKERLTYGWKRDYVMAEYLLISMTFLSQDQGNSNVKFIKSVNINQEKHVFSFGYGRNE